MIVKCPRCSARYKIDAQTIPDEGMYAKCAKCENVFFARKRSDEEVARLREKRRKGPELHTPTATPEPTRKESRVTAPEPVPAESGVAPQSARETDYQSTGLEETEREVSPNAPEMEAISASEEPVSPLSQDAIEALMSASTPKPEPAKPEPAGPLGQDDIAAILAANAPKPEPVKETPSSGVMSQDDIEALLSANAPKPEPAGPLGQDDIAAILAANAPKPEPVKETPSSGRRMTLKPCCRPTLPSRNPLRPRPRKSQRAPCPRMTLNPCSALTNPWISIWIKRQWRFPQLAGFRMI
ncbi:MAG: zinc-ribbon domain-containing protein [Nitrospinae bacterium]|nr:zinc-ribbon domain-containing protein [Nitrospinota bacterium]